MSGPQVAGGKAVLKAALANRTSDPTRIRDFLISSASPVKLTNADGSPPTVFDTVAKQGAGLANFYHALHHTTEVSPAVLYLNDSAHANLQQSFVITNVGQKTQTYALSHTAAGTLISMDKATNFWNSFPVPTDPQAATANINPAGLTLDAGQSSTVTVSFTPPSLDSSVIPMFSGWIVVTSSNEADTELGSVSIPYFGVGTDLSKEAVFDLGSDAVGTQGPHLEDADSNTVYNDTSTYTLAQIGDNEYDSPSVVARLRLGCERLTVDLVRADTAYKASIPISDPPAGQASQAQALALHRRAQHRRLDRVIRRDSPHETELQRRDGKFDDVPIIGRVMEMKTNARDIEIDNTVQGMLEGTILGGSDGNQNITVSDGQYRLLVRASRLFSDLSLDASYESYLTHAFTIARSGNTTVAN